MTGLDVKKASLNDLRKMKKLGEIRPSLHSETAPDLPRDFWDDAVLVNYTHRSKSD